MRMKPLTSRYALLYNDANQKEDDMASIYSKAKRGWRTAKKAGRAASAASRLANAVGTGGTGASTAVTSVAFGAAAIGTVLMLAKSVLPFIVEQVLPVAAMLLVCAIVLRFAIAYAGIGKSGAGDAAAKETGSGKDAGKTGTKRKPKAESNRCDGSDAGANGGDAGGAGTQWSPFPAAGADGKFTLADFILWKITSRRVAAGHWNPYSACGDADSTEK